MLQFQKDRFDEKSRKTKIFKKISILFGNMLRQKEKSEIFDFFADVAVKKNWGKFGQMLRPQK